MFIMIVISYRSNFYALIALILICFVREVFLGANDLHFQDGSFAVDVVAGDVFFEIVDPRELRYSYRLRPARDFGAPFNESVVFKKIRLVPANPFDACSEILNSEEIFGQIAFVERGECSFVLKSHLAEKAGARAVIITEMRTMYGEETLDESLDYLIEMLDDKTNYEVNIPSGFLVGKSGITIMKTLRKLGKRHAVVNLPINMTYVPIHKMNQPPWVGV